LPGITAEYCPEMEIDEIGNIDIFCSNTGKEMCEKGTEKNYLILL